MATQPHLFLPPVGNRVHRESIILFYILFSFGWSLQAGLMSISEGLRKCSGYRHMPPNEMKSPMEQHFEKHLGAPLRAGIFAPPARPLLYFVRFCEPWRHEWLR